MYFSMKKNRYTSSSWFNINFKYNYAPFNNIEAMSSLKKEKDFDEKKPVMSTGFSWSA